MLHRVLTEYGARFAWHAVPCTLHDPPYAAMGAGLLAPSLCRFDELLDRDTRVLRELAHADHVKHDDLAAPIRAPAITHHPSMPRPHASVRSARDNAHDAMRAPSKVR